VIVPKMSIGIAEQNSRPGSPGANRSLHPSAGAQVDFTSDYSAISQPVDPVHWPISRLYFRLYAKMYDGFARSNICIP
jgi:hypothetical protein